MTESLSPRVRNPQVEALFQNWNLEFELVDEFPIADVQTIAGQQVRDAVNIANKDTVAEYLVQHKNGAIFPPIVLRRPGIMLDGNTRLAMATQAGRTTFPAYLVDVNSGDLAKALGAQLNQMGGQRLTPAEAYRNALIMMDDLAFTDPQIGAAVGRSGQQVRAWRQEIEAAKHAERVNVEKEFAKVPASQHKVLARVVQDKPFAEVVKLTSGRRVPHAELQRIVKEIETAPSEAAAVAVVERAKVDLRPTGPGGLAVAVNLKAKRMRMVLPQVLNLAPPEDVYDPAKAAEDRKAWQQIKAMSERMLDMYDHMPQQLTLDSADATPAAATIDDAASTA
jgi:hypothetical protein